MNTTRIRQRFTTALNRINQYVRFDDSVVSYLVLLIVSLSILFPLYWMVATSVKSSQEFITFPPNLIPQSPVLDPYITALQEGLWVQWFVNTSIIAIGSTIFILAISIPAAYVLARREFPGATVFLLLFLSTMMVPPQILLIPLFEMFSQIGLVNSYIGLIFSLSMLFTGFSTFLLYGFFQTLPSSIEDAARVAGIGEVKMFIRIILPMAKPGVATAALFLFVFSWNEYLFALVLMQERSAYTISVALKSFQGLHGSVVYNQMMAVSTLAAVPVLLLFVVAQDRFIEGITTGFEG